MFRKLFDWLNDLDSRQLLALAGVVMVVIFAVFYSSLSWLTSKDEDDKDLLRPSTAANVRTVVTAKKDIPPLTIIKADMLMTKEVVEDFAPQDAMTDISDVVNISAKTEIFEGDVITRRKLLSDSKKLTFVDSIPSNCRAVSISVSDITGVDGFAKPGDKVDLLLVENDENRKATARVLLQNVLLLSINQNMERSSDSPTEEGGEITTSPTVNPSIATVALRPNEILKLISASKLGEIYLTLQPLHPTEKFSDEEGYTIKSVNAKEPQPKQIQQQVTPPPQITELPPIPSARPALNTPQQKNDVFYEENKMEIIQGDKIVQNQ